MRVISFCQYLTATGFPWRDEDYAASKFIKAIKDRAVNGYANVPLPDGVRRLDESTAPQAREWFAYWCATKLPGIISGQFVIVPVPASQYVLGSPIGRTGQIAERIAELYPLARVDHALVWREPVVRATDGGPRDQRELYGFLDGSRLRVRGQNVVLFDDVWTSGGHLKAAAAWIRDVGGLVDLAICAGCTTQTPMTDPFKVPDCFLEPWEPQL